MQTPLRLNIVGCGKLGRTMARLWADHQLIDLAGICNQSVSSAEQALTFITSSKASEKWRLTTVVTDQLTELPEADLWLIATPDGEIRNTAKMLAESNLLTKESVVFHCCGSLASSELIPIESQSSHTASAHPIHSFASPEHSLLSFSGTFCAMEGDPKALEKITPLFEKIGGKTFPVDTNSKPLYHAATAVASNFLVTLLDASLNMLEKSGVPRLAARELIRPIVMQTAENVCIRDTTASLTGPISRGEISTIESHLHAIAEQIPDLLSLYTKLGVNTVELAAKQNTNGDDSRPLKELHEKLKSL